MMPGMLGFYIYLTSFYALKRRSLGRRSFWKGTKLTSTSFKCAFLINQFKVECSTQNNGCSTPDNKVIVEELFEVVLHHLPTQKILDSCITTLQPGG